MPISISTALTTEVQWPLGFVDNKSIFELLHVIEEGQKTVYITRQVASSVNGYILLQKDTLTFLKLLKLGKMLFEVTFTQG